MALIIPANYDPHLTVRETQEAIKYIRDTANEIVRISRMAAPVADCFVCTCRKNLRDRAERNGI